MAMRRTRVKICGLTRPQDVRFAVDAGVDAIGLVCYPPSKRYLSPDDATRLRAGIPAFVSTVCLFVDPAPDEVRLVMDQVRPDLLQFHGDESAEFCRQFNVPYLKAFRVGAPGLDTAHKLASH